MDSLEDEERKDFQILTTANSQPNDYRDDIPIFWKTFGGTVFSIIFLLSITLCGYILNQVNQIQFAVNNLTGDTIKKQEFNESNKTNADNVNRRFLTLEETLSQRSTALDDLRIRLSSLDEHHKDHAATLEKFSTHNEQQNEDLQQLRERVAQLEILLKKQTEAHPK